ncbi:MAG: hypothetical protein FJ098_13505 [Deltaproteobacteria bacterium]|nr:hypothetical protein [Deltaproteobacteria bacterium]
MTKGELMKVVAGVALVVLLGLGMAGCDNKKDIMAACDCMVECMDDFGNDTPQAEMQCQKECKGKFYEGFEQGAQMARQVLDGTREDCKL